MIVVGLPTLYPMRCVRCRARTTSKRSLPKHIRWCKHCHCTVMYMNIPLPDLGYPWIPKVVTGSKAWSN